MIMTSLREVKSYLLYDRLSVKSRLNNMTIVIQSRNIKHVKTLTYLNLLVFQWKFKSTNLPIHGKKITENDQSHNQQ